MTEDNEKVRKASLLTKAQRRFIRGETDYHESMQRQTERRIRDRVYNAMLDISLLAREYPITELDKAFENPPDETPRPPDAAHGVAAMADFFTLKYLVHRELEQEADAPEGWRFAMDAKNGLELAFKRLDVAADVSVDVEINRQGDLKDIAENTDDYSTLSLDRLDELFSGDFISGDEYGQAFIKKDERGDFD